MNKLIDELESAAKKATPGPWKCIEREIDIGFTQAIWTKLFNVEGINAFVSFQSQREAKPDAEYISLCYPENIIKLCAMVREAEKALEFYSKRSGGIEDIRNPEGLIQEGQTAREALKKLRGEE